MLRCATEREKCGGGRQADPAEPNPDVCNFSLVDTTPQHHAPLFPSFAELLHTLLSRILSSLVHCPSLCIGTSHIGQYVPKTSSMFFLSPWS